MEKTVFFNGKLIPLSQAKVSVLDRGFVFADGLYEVIRCYRKKPFALDGHLQRFKRSAEGIYMELPYGLDRWREICYELCEETDLGQFSLYLQVTRGPAPRDHRIPEQYEPTVFAYADPVSPEMEYRWENLSKAMTLKDGRWDRCHIKSVALLPNILARDEARRKGADEALWLGPGQVVYEGTASNAFMIEEGVLYTHPLCNKILGGITREVILKVAAELGLEVRQEGKTIQDFLAADEVFVTGTKREIMPLVEIDGQAVSDGKMGEWTRKIHEGMMEYIARDCGLDSCY
jgi:D-alanine transaminase